MLDVVYAHRVEADHPPYPSTWHPFRVACTAEVDHSGPSMPYYVKVRPNTPGGGRDAAAVQISEVVGLGVAKAVGFRTHSVALVRASAAFAERVNGLDGYPVMCEGDHFGTVWLDSVTVGNEASIGRYARRKELIWLWAMDKWLCTADRYDSEGNILFVPEGGGQMTMIPSDHSDCFDGAHRFTSEHLAQLAVGNPPRDCPALVRDAIWDDGGCGQLEEGIDRVRFACERLPEILASVPVEWWTEAELDPGVVRDCLAGRAERMESICYLPYWQETAGGIGNAIAGGKLFG